MNPEDHEALAQMARMALTFYRAVLRDGASEREAIVVTSAIVAGMLSSQQASTDEQAS